MPRLPSDSPSVRSPSRSALAWVALATAVAVLTSLAGCDRGAKPAAGPHSDADGQLRYGSLVFEPCSLTAPAAAAVEARCSSLEVAEARREEAPGKPAGTAADTAADQAASGRKIRLAIALVPANGAAEADPVYMIAGGPGQSALDSYAQVHAAFHHVRRNRHIILVDARGTGGSQPLRCQDSDGQDAFADPGHEAPDKARALAEHCRDELSKTADLRFYTTGDHIRDLDQVRAALGVERINLVGISYGTRVAQQYAKAFPARTRSLVLDSVVPNSLALGQDHARNLEAALTAHFERCRALKACLDQMGDPARQLAAIRSRLEAAGQAAVRYRDPVSGDWREEIPRYGHLAGLLRMYAYHPATAATLPLILHEAANQRYESLLAQARNLTGSLGQSIYHGMQLSVMCSEDVDDFHPDADDRDTVLGNVLVELSRVQCAVWPKGRRAADFREPLTGDTPVLVLSGELDPVTPPRYGDEVVAPLTQGRHLVLSGQGHGVLGVGCMPRLFAQFLERADAEGLDPACLKPLKALPPFTGNYGWEP